MKSAYYLHPRLTDKPIIIYGVGVMGEEAYRRLKAYGIRPAAFCDTYKTGFTLHGKKVLSLPEVDRVYGKNHVIFFISSDNYYIEIKRTLREFGVENGNILSTALEQFCDTGVTPEPFVLDSGQLRRLQSCLLDLLSTLDEICERHKIRYFLDGGTLLGAVRHKGFIPWDDDVDVLMLREDHDRFFKICETELKEFYHGKYMTDYQDLLANMYIYHIKRAGTRKRGFGYAAREQEMGIDIFPLDKVSKPGGVLWFLQSRTQSLLNLAKRRKQFGAEVGVVSKIVARILSLGQIRRAARAICCLRNKSNAKYLYHFFAGRFKTNLIYPREWFEERVLLEFEGRCFYAPKEYHKMLTAIYGDYLQMPPPHLRVANHAWTVFDLGEEDG